MGSEAEENQHSSIPKLPLFSAPPVMQMESSPERSGTVTPPLQTSGSVPFRWEQEPGKPKVCNALVTYINPTDKSLELPPRLLVVPSPTFLQQGPNVTSNRFRSQPSFRIEDNTNCYGSSGTGDRGLLSGTRNILLKGDSGWFGSWRKNVKRDQVSGSSHVFPSSSTCIADATVAHDKKMMKRSGSSSSFSHHGKARVWKSIREGMKQVVTLQWRSKKLKKKDETNNHIICTILQ